MKKIISIYMVVVCLFCCISCSNEKEEEIQYNEIQLSKYNYKQYLNIMKYVTDFSVSELSNGGKLYSCVFNFETSGIGDYVYENVTIKYKNYGGDWENDTISSASGLEIKIGSDGRSHVSYGAWTESPYNQITPCTFANTAELSIVSVTGTVLVPVE